MLRKFLPLFILTVIALLVSIAFVVASPFFQGDEEVVEEKEEVEEEEIVLSSVEKKLNEIVIPEVRFDNVTMDEAVEFLRVRSIECDRSGLDDSQKGIGFIVRGSKVISDLDGFDGSGDFWDAVDPDAVLIKSLHLRDVSLVILLNEICDAAQLEWEIDSVSHKIVISPKKQPLSLEELKKIRLPKFELNDGTVSHALEKLMFEVYEDDEGDPVELRFVFVARPDYHRGNEADEAKKAFSKKISMVVRDHSLPDLMDVICERFGVDWNLEKFVIKVIPKMPLGADLEDPFQKR